MHSRPDPPAGLTRTAAFAVGVDARRLSKKKYPRDNLLT
jgi:hypothetical protein